MKKIIILIMAFILLISNVSFATNDNQIDDYYIKITEQIAEQESKIGEKFTLTINIDGENIIFLDAKPFVDNNNRTLVPLRFVAEEFGVEVKWDDKEQRVDLIYDNTLIQFYINQNKFLVNGIAKEMDTKAIIKDGRTMIPIRYFAENLGITVDFNNKYNIISLLIKDPIINGNAKELGYEFNYNTGTITDYLSNEVDVIIPYSFKTSTGKDVVVRKIGEKAFYKKKIKSVVIPNGVEYINGGAFSFNELSKVILPSNLKLIHLGSFENNKINLIEFPDTLLKISNSAFYNNDLTVVKIPKNVKEIGYGAFDENPLKTVTIYNKNISLNESFGVTKPTFN